MPHICGFDRWPKNSMKRVIRSMTVMFKKIAQAQTGKDSTAKLTKEETSQAINELHRFLAENFQVYVPFPSQEEM